MTRTDITHAPRRRTTTTNRHRMRIVGAALSCALLLAACVPSVSTETTEQGPAHVDFPRSVVVPAGVSTAADTVQISAAPQRIAALTYETAELVAALGASDRLVMVPKAVTNPVLTHHHQEMEQVETKAATESTTNAEAVIATAPDLVLLSARHGLEDGAGQVLAAAGIPVLVLPNSWGTVEEMLSNIDLVGQALGLDAAAADLTKKIDDGVTAAGAKPPADAGALPRVLVLSNQAGQPFVTTGSAFPLEMLRHAGATDAAADLGMRHSGPITAEQVIQADADAILLVDMNGSGRKIFTPLLDNPAVAALPAVAQDRMMLVEGRQVQALGLSGVVDGLEELTAWLATDAT